MSIKILLKVQLIKWYRGDSVKLDEIKSEIYNIINDRFEFENNVDFESELISLADENLKHKKIFRIKRKGIKVDRWKTLVLVEIETDNENDIKDELKEIISWIASIKESLTGTENTDLYLLLAFNDVVDKDECLRIESTEEFCRKYVLMPSENISEFVGRTFIQGLSDSTDTVVGEDPIEKAFSKTAIQHSWLSPEIQKKWKNAFLELSSDELVDALLEGDVIV